MNATVAERSGKARAIRNQGSPDAQRRRSVTGGSPQQAARARVKERDDVERAARPGARPHLRLVVDHGRVVDPAVMPGMPVRVGDAAVMDRGTEESPRRTGAGSLRGTGTLRGTGALRGTAGLGSGVRGAETSRRHGYARRAAAARDEREWRAPGGRVRLTRRGRLVITSTMVVLIAVAFMVLASAVQVTVHPG